MDNLRECQGSKPIEINGLWTSMDLHGTQFDIIIGAGNETRTRDLNLGKYMPSLA